LGPWSTRFRELCVIRNSAQFCRDLFGPHIEYECLCDVRANGVDCASSLLFLLGAPGPQGDEAGLVRARGSCEQRDIRIARF
jgi:hypothetical protein